MNQVDALGHAAGALEWFARQGSDEAAEAAGVVLQMQQTIIRRRARRRQRPVKTQAAADFVRAALREARS